MRHTLLVAALAALLPQIALAADAEVDALAGKVDGKVLTWRRDIHQHPELGNREVRTANWWPITCARSVSRTCVPASPPLV